MSRFALLGVLLALGLTQAAAPARADPSDAKAPAKASAFAPRHTGQRVFGAPIGPQILHKRKPLTHRASPAASASTTRATTAAPQP